MDMSQAVSPQNAHYTNRKRILEYHLNRTVSFENISSIREVVQHYINTRDIFPPKLQKLFPRTNNDSKSVESLVTGKKLKVNVLVFLAYEFSQ